MNDPLMLRRFAARGRSEPEELTPGGREGLPEEMSHMAAIGATRKEFDAGREALIESSLVEEFVKRAAEVFARHEESDVLRRAILFTFPTEGESLEISFISLYAALEATLTFFRHQGRYKILSPEEFAALERDLKRWLKEHPLLAARSAERALIYEKIRELNRLPFATVFKKFCAAHALDLDDLWPVLGQPEAWPLTEIRHRLVHGDAFLERPEAALVCARQHLRWTVERMLLAVLDWPISESRASADYLSAHEAAHRNWHEARASFA
jgi:hypothetical protein